MTDHLVRPTLNVEQLRTALATLGIDPCADHAPDDPEQEIAGLLAAMLAGIQWHIQESAQQYGEQIDVSYHLMRAHLGFPPCRCGSPNDAA